MSPRDAENKKNDNSDESLPHIVALIENQLSQNNKTVKITLVEHLIGVNKTYRCKMETNTSSYTSNNSIVIKYNSKKPVKHSEDILHDLDDYQKRFNNEVASLTYLNSIQFPDKVHPELIHQDIMNQLIVTKDMGNHPTLMELMNDPTLEKPETYLIKYIRLFAELHRYTLNDWKRFKETQKRLQASSPLSDSTMDFRKHLTELKEHLDYLGTEYTLNEEAIIAEFTMVEDTIFNQSNPLYGFIHADSGIQNVNIDPENGKMVLFDYEFADTGYILLDIAGLFLGFPQSGKGKRVPEKFYDSLIKEYFNAMSLMSDNFDDMLLYALLHWTVGRVLSTWMFYLKPNIDDLESLRTDILNSTYTSNHECLHFLRKNKFPHLRNLIEVTQSFLAETWEDIKLKDYFPVFTQPS